MQSSNLAEITIFEQRREMKMLVLAIWFFLVVPAAMAIVACYGAAMTKTEWDIQNDLNEQEEYLKAWKEEYRK